MAEGTIHAHLGGGRRAQHSENIGENELINRVGRSPMIEMRHTVDDELRVATSKTYLSLRSVFHRNMDTLIAFSRSAKEMHGRGKPSERIVVLTDKHLYVVTPPSPAIFAPCAGGGCFSWKEFSRCCGRTGAVVTPVLSGNGPPTTSTTLNHHVLFQFVAAVIVVQFSDAKDADRCGLVVQSLTGTPLEKLSDAESSGARHFARDQKKINLISSAASAAPTTASVRAKSAVSVDQSVTDDGATAASSGTGGKRVLPPQPSAHSVATKSSTETSAGGQQTGTIENMLRYILDQEKDAAGEGYESLFPSKGIQTENETAEIETQTELLGVERGCSPIAELLNVEESESSSNYSDFDPSDVWKTLTPGGGGGGVRQQHTGRSSPSPSRAHGGPHALSSSFARSVAFSEPSGGTGRTKLAKASEDMSVGTVGEETVVGSDTEPTAESASAAGGSAVSSGFLSWLGVLSPYAPAFQEHGMDSVSRLMKLTDKELETLLDNVGMHKHGHRVLFASKMGVLRQAKGTRR